MTISFDLRKAFQILVSFFVVAGTLFYIPFSSGTNQQQAVEWGYMIQELFFRYGVFTLFLVSLFLNPLRITNLKWEAVLVIFIIGASFFSDFGTQERRAILNVITGVLFIKIVADNVETSSVKAFAYPMLAIVLLNLTLATFQYFGKDPLFIGPPNMGPLDAIIGFMRVKAHLATLAAIISPLLIGFSPWLLLLALPLIAVGNSSAAVAAFVASCGLYAWLKLPRRLFWLVCTGVILCGFFYIFKYDAPGGDFGHRFEVWQMTLDRTLHSNPLIGNGIGSFAKWAPHTAQATTQEPLIWLWAHNEYLQAFYEIGIIGILIIVMIIRKLVLDFIRHKDNYHVQILFLPVLSILIISFLHFPFHLARFVIPCLFCVAIFKARVTDLCP